MVQKGKIFREQGRKEENETKRFFSKKIGRVGSTYSRKP
jgi:hypothetical protein